MKWDNMNQLCDVVRESSFAIHKYHRNGHLEKVYENALVHRLRKQALKVQQQHPLTVYDEDGAVLGEYFADLFIADCLIVELKACRTIAEVHVAQILGYLRASRIETGLLINFGAARLYIKKYLTTSETHCSCDMPTEAHSPDLSLFVSLCVFRGNSQSRTPAA